MAAEHATQLGVSLETKLYRYTLVACGAAAGALTMTLVGYLYPGVLAPQPGISDGVYGAIMGGTAVGLLAVAVALAEVDA